MRAKRQPEVTVAVVVKDRLEWMERCLHAVEQQAGVEFDILVIDNGSTDGTYQMLLDRQANSAGRLTVLQRSGSLGHIRNVALQEAHTPIVAFTDSDCVPGAGWLVAGLREFSDNTGVVQGRTVPIRATRSWEITINVPKFNNRFETCNIFYRRDALLGVGGFGADMPQLGEDMMAGWRLLRSGWDSGWAHDAVVAHEVTYPSITWWLRRGWRYEAWPQFVKEFPEARDELLYRRYLLNRRQLLPIAAVIGAIASTALLSPWPALLIVPLMWRWRPQPRRGRTIRNSCCAMLYELAVLAGLIRGSVKTRTLVL